MNLIFLSETDFISDHHVCLKDRRHRHIVSILKSTVGDYLNVGLLNGKIGKGKIAALSDTSIELDVECNQNPPTPIDLTLILALPRPIIVPRIIAAVVAMGVKRIILFHSNRVEKSYWASPVLREDKLHEASLLGLEQAGDTILPTITLHKQFKPFVEDELKGLITNTKAFVAHPDSRSSQPCPSNVAGPVSLVIGPEGGFIPYEIEKLKMCGCVPILLSQRILKVETAVTALVSKLKL